jgi:RNA polymerase sigma-70 factor, ECF subfamily
VDSQFRDVYFQYYTKVIRVAYYILKNKEIAEDIAQDVFLKLWKKRGEWANIKSMEAYLVQMSKNESLNYLETVKKESDNLISLKADTLALAQTTVTATDEFKKELERGVSMLAPQCRLIFSLSRFEGLDNDEIATYLGISKRTVETQISMALRILRADLKRTRWPSLDVSIPIALAIIFG